jgi:GH25 family lysozyme M1 (1,4-beta-N-acetylmuramidase)
MRTLESTSKAMNPTNHASFPWLALLVLGLGLLAGPERALAQRPLGIDVSEGSGFITWTTVKNAGVTFAWAEASEGAGFPDSQFVNNMNNAKAAGVLIGAYHYARYDLGTSATAEANWFWSVASPYLKADGASLMPALVVEADITNYTRTALSEWVNTWCQTVVNEAVANGVTVRPMIYTTCWYADTYLDSTGTQWPLWMADWEESGGPMPGEPGWGSPSGAPCTLPWSNWTVWQFGYGQFPGVASECGLDVYNGTYADLAQTLVITGACLPPGIVTQPPSQAVCEGGSVALCVTATGSPPLYYQWRLNGANIAGATRSCCSFGLGPGDLGDSFTVVVSNACGSVTSAPALLTLYPPPAVVSPPQSLVVTQGASLTLSVTATGSPLSYQWQRNGTNFFGTTSSYTISNIKPHSAGGYTVVLSNICNTITSPVAWLTVVMPLPSQTATPGAGVVFTVTNYGGDPSLACQWQKNGTNLSDGGNVCGSATTNLSLNHLSTNDAGVYTAMVSDEADSTASVSAALTVAFQPGHFDLACLLPGGALQLGMSGESNCNYALEATSNWVDWTSLTTLTSPNGLFQYTESSVTNGGQRFYRLRLAQ